MESGRVRTAVVMWSGLGAHGGGCGRVGGGLRSESGGLRTLFGGRSDAISALKRVSCPVCARAGVFVREAAAADGLDGLVRTGMVLVVGQWGGEGFAFGGFEAVGEVGPVHGFFAGGLDLMNSYNAVVAGDEAFGGVGDGAGVGVMGCAGEGGGAEEFDGLVAEVCGDGGPGVEGHDGAGDGFGGLVEVCVAVGFGEFVGAGDE